MPNNFALLALIAWPLVGILIFRMVKDREQAIITTFVWSYMFLPSGVGFDFPGLPPLEKQNIPALVLLLLLVFYKNKCDYIVPRERLILLFLLSYIIGRFITAVINDDPIYVASIIIPGTRLYDAISGVVLSVIFLIPIIIGYNFLYTKDAQFKILFTILSVGLLYSIILLIEIRLSPQFHIWAYGFFPHSFLQQVRGGGFRPVGFLGHGLYAAFFVMSCVAAACILLKEQNFSRKLQVVTRIRMNLGMVAIYMFVLLILCKTLGSVILGVFLVLCITLLSPMAQVRIAAVLVSIAILFPILRGNDLFPTETMLSVAGAISEKRQASLNTRFLNEDKLLAKAKERPIFGWGSWGRNRIYSQRTGRDVSIVDGYWVGIIGTAGWIGFLALFGFMAMPVYLIIRRYKGEEQANLSPITSGLTLLLAINMIELLPNSTLFPWTWLIAGALWGHAVKASPVGGELEILPKRSRTIL